MRRLRNTLMLWAFGFWKVPMILWTRPVVEELTDERCIVRIALRRRTRNHVHSMYLAAFAVGADAAAALLVFHATRAAPAAVVPLFKDFHADFLRRAEGDVLFCCEDGAAIRDAVARAAATGERVNLPVQVVATVTPTQGRGPAARMSLTLSVKLRSAKRQ